MDDTMSITSQASLTTIQSLPKPSALVLKLLFARIVVLLEINSSSSNASSECQNTGRRAVQQRPLQLGKFINYEGMTPYVFKINTPSSVPTSTKVIAYKPFTLF